MTLAFVLGYVFAEITRSAREFVDDAEEQDQHDQDEDDVVDDG